MGARRSIGLAFLVVATACARQSGVQSTVPEPIDRERGPGASIQADFWGGLVTRSVDVAFSVDQSAYVLVGHLGGDGVIRVVYPEVPDLGQLAQPLRPRRTVRTSPFHAFYDGAPSAYTFRIAPYRSTAAKFASYDGMGHGYVFIIASRTPLRYDVIVDGYEWLDVPVRNYDEAADPRKAVQQYASALTHGGRYTLKFATALMSQGFISTAAAAMDCAALTTLGLGHMATFWNSWGLGVPSSLWQAEYNSRNLFGRACGMPHYATLNNVFYFEGIQRQWMRSNPWPHQLEPRTPIVRPDEYTPMKKRPTYRPFGERPTTASQSAFNSTPRSYAPIQRPVASGSSRDAGGTFTRGPSISRPSSGPSSGPVTSRAPVSAPASRPSTSTPPATTSSSTTTTTTKKN